MSRIGKKTIVIPETVKVEIKDGQFQVKGPKGSVSRILTSKVDVIISDKDIQVKRKNDSRESRSLHGLTRTLIDNMVKGVTEGFEKKLEIIGLGYKAQVQGKGLQLILGYTKPIQFDLPANVQAKVDANTKITLSSPDKEILGDIASKIRALRLPEPYKGTGIRYEGEVIIRKVGKTGTAAAA